jgi:dTDP-4-amino-4,6-dideoxygalactose transaminase
MPKARSWMISISSGGQLKKKMPMTQKMISHVASIPLSPFFTDDEVKKIIVSVKKYFNQG